MAKKFNELHCGSKIRFGSYSVDGEGAHQIKWIKVNSDDTTILAEYVEDVLAFDRGEKYNKNVFRRYSGNNRYSVSNIDQFLNSSSDKWYNARHEFDEPPLYANRPGFLYYFKEWERNAIVDTEIKTALPLCDSSDKYENVVRKVFLPSLTNIFGARVRGVDEGSQYDYFTKEGARFECLTSPAIDETSFYDSYLLRSFCEDSFSMVCGVSYEGEATYYEANVDYVGVRPALRLNPETMVSDEPDEEGYYEIIQLKPDDIFFEDEFFKLLEINK